MSLLAGVTVETGWEKRRQWLLTLVAAIGLHVAFAAFILWKPDSGIALQPIAAPMVFEVSMVAAPKAEPTALPIDVEQQKSSTAPQKKNQVKTIEQVKEPPIKPVVEKAAEVVLQPKETVEEQIEEETEAKEVVEEKQQETQEQNSDEMAMGEVLVAESTAPAAIPSEEAEVVSAPHQGAISQQQADAEQAWRGRMQAHLERRKRYPRRAQILGQEGTPWVRFTFDREGKVLKVELLNPSGYNVLDKEALSLVKRAQPLPSPPEHIIGNSLTLSVPIEFSRR